MSGLKIKLKFGGASVAPAPQSSSDRQALGGGGAASADVKPKKEKKEKRKRSREEGSHSAEASTFPATGVLACLAASALSCASCRKSNMCQSFLVLLQVLLRLHSPVARLRRRFALRSKATGARRHARGPAMLKAPLASRQEKSARNIGMAAAALDMHRCQSFVSLASRSGHLLERQDLPSAPFSV